MHCNCDALSGGRRCLSTLRSCGSNQQKLAAAVLGLDGKKNINKNKSLLIYVSLATRHNPRPPDSDQCVDDLQQAFFHGLRPWTRANSVFTGWWCFHNDSYGAPRSDHPGYLTLINKMVDCGLMQDDQYDYRSSHVRRLKPFYHCQQHG